MEKRKIIFIAPEFYDYHKIITEKLRELFGETFFFPERKTNGLYTLLNNINPKLINLYQKIYFFFIWQQVKKEENITDLFVIKGNKMPISFIKKLKKQPKIPSCFFMLSELLFSDSKLCNDSSISVDIFLFKIIQKSFSLTYQFY